MNLPRRRLIKPEGMGFYGGPLSNFNGGPFHVIVAIQWPEAEVLVPVTSVKTVEHYFQAAKAMSNIDAVWILEAPGPGAAKARGRQIALRPDWEEIKADVMYHAVKAKFSQMPYFRDFLLGTGSDFLYEDSPTDAVWGLWNQRDGDWTGQNLLGEILMRVREELRR